MTHEELAASSKYVSVPVPISEHSILEMLNIVQNVVDRVEAGEIRSTQLYNRCRGALETAGLVDPESPKGYGCRYEPSN